MYPSEKTIPYRPSPADLENLRLLRKRMNPSCSTEDGEEEMPEEINAWYSKLDPTNQTVEKKTS